MYEPYTSSLTTMSSSLTERAPREAAGADQHEANGVTGDRQAWPHTDSGRRAAPAVTASTWRRSVSVMLPVR